MNGWSCIAAVFGSQWMLLPQRLKCSSVIVSAGLGQPSGPLCGAASSFQTHTSQLLVPESERRDWYSYLKKALCVTFGVISCASDALVWGKISLFKNLILKNGLVLLVFLCPPSPSLLLSSAQHSGFTASYLPLVKAVPRLLKSLLPGGKEGRDQTAVHQQVDSFSLFIVLCIKACLRPASLSGI